ncbi:MAG: hypothetical protein A2W18_01240 [Candidatus Muproteobacteria bacterium RBG_16_60_9]|uniref:DUF86 domain-containing protein n=1 Tax=Candidatus Muproteobacteria bacterium RBG_16_60_9 TaxID=1817755 RepID=A0A1F6V3U0_9PROT|nr:MAG: hypothetical protein A2W18_01240 [Candidatus Muproteobacteria bacterium RBG_16_60_9]
MSRDDAIVLDILKSAQLVIEFVGSLDKEAFLRDRKTQSAVLHQLLLVGEAVKRLSENYRAAHPEIPWKRVAGMRDVLIHQYDDVDEVWKTVKAEIPKLSSQLQSLDPRK